MKYKYVALVLLTARVSFAVCETDRKEYTDWVSRCETLSAASQAAGIAGGICAFWTFGASMAPCIGLSIAAHDACCKKDTWRAKLNICEEREREMARNQLKRAEQLRLKREKIERLLISSDKLHKRQMKIANKTYDERLVKFLTRYEAEGWDLESAEAKKYIQRKKEKIERNREKYVAVLLDWKNKHDASIIDYCNREFGN